MYPHLLSWSTWWLASCVFHFFKPRLHANAMAIPTNAHAQKPHKQSANKRQMSLLPLLLLHFFSKYLSLSYCCCAVTSVVSTAAPFPWCKLHDFAIQKSIRIRPQTRSILQYEDIQFSIRPDKSPSFAGGGGVSGGPLPKGRKGWTEGRQWIVGGKTTK